MLVHMRMNIFKIVNILLTFFIEKITVAELLSGIDSLCRSRKNDEKKEKFSYLR